MQDSNAGLPRRAYNVGEVAHMIGRSKKAVYAMCQGGELDFIQEVKGGVISIPVDALEDWLSRRRLARTG